MSHEFCTVSSLKYSGFSVIPIDTACKGTYKNVNRQISVRLVVLFYAFLYVSGREGGYEAVPRRTEEQATRVGTAGVGGYEAVPRRTEQLGREEGSSPAGMLIMRAGNVSFFR